MSVLLASTALLLLAGMASPAISPASPSALDGVWQAKRNFGPEIRGHLMVTRRGGTWRGEIAGQSATAPVRGDSIALVIAGGRGELQGRVTPRRDEIRGHWIQPPTVNAGGRYASPVTLKRHTDGSFRGEVAPLEDEFTLYLVVSTRPDGSVGAFVQNPDRNVGVFLNIDRIGRDGSAIKLIGRSRGSSQDRVLADGVYRPGENRAADRITLYLPSRGGSYDFAPIDDDPGSFFYSRGRNPDGFQYRPPPAENDGWTTGRLEEVGMSVAPIKDFIEKIIDPPAKSLHDPSIHGFLIARRGKLVLEEYFHGFHREKPHDTRSASKSVAAMLVGAAIQHGAPLKVSSSVYKTIYDNQPPTNVDPRKMRMTVEHLLMMSSGFNCDDRNPSAPGNEDVMQQQKEDLDWYHYTLNLPMIDEPGEKPVYCSVDSNLLGAVLASATKTSVFDLFQTLIADPLQIKKYHFFLSPKNDPYLGGGMYWLPRDFMKLGQVVINGGTWNGRRIVSQEWARRATSPLVQLGKYRYGYLWWSIEYPYRGRTVRAFFAGGNGGQIVMGIPELELVVAFYAGNYSDPVLFKIQEEFIPQYILPAIS